MPKADFDFALAKPDLKLGSLNIFIIEWRLDKPQRYSEVGVTD